MTSRSSRFKARYNLRRYSKSLINAQSFCSVEEAEIQHASGLRDYQIATNEQKAHRQQRQLENEIAYENEKTAALIEKQKAEIDANLKLESAKRKLQLSNKFVEIQTKRMMLEEKRQLSECETQRALSYVIAGKPVPTSNEWTWGKSNLLQ
jgi:hypothetical protein